MLGARPKDGGEWMQISRALVDVGAEVYDVCASYHARFAVDLARPSGQD